MQQWSSPQTTCSSYLITGCSYCGASPPPAPSLCLFSSFCPSVCLSVRVVSFLALLFRCCVVFLAVVVCTRVTCHSPCRHVLSFQSSAEKQLIERLPTMQYQENSRKLVAAEHGEEDKVGDTSPQQCRNTIPRRESSIRIVCHDLSAMDIPIHNQIQSLSSESVDCEYAGS